VRMTAAEYRADSAKPKKPSKYRNVPVTVDGIRFASKREAAYYCELKLREKAGEVSGLSLQHHFVLHGPDGLLITTYVADFCFWDSTADRFRVIDVKGMETKEFRIKKRLMKSLKGIDVEIVK
jgi:hypothetical protein